MYKTVEAIVEPSGSVRLLEPVVVTVPTRAMLTVLTVAATPLADIANSDSITQWLAVHPLPVSARRSHEQIEAAICEDRAAWD